MGAYKLSLIPGWNLVSLPGTPIDPSIGSVMGGSMQASIVLAYQDDAWLTAVNDNGTWRGTLTDIVGGLRLLGNRTNRVSSPSRR